MTRPTGPDRARRLGNPGKRPLRALAGAGWPLAPLGAPPAHLGASGRAAWAIMQGCPWIASSDAIGAQLFCDLLDRRDTLGLIVAAEPFVAGSMGQPRPHPAAALLVATEQELVRWARLLILTPDDRARFGITARVAPPSAVDRLLAKRAALRKETAP